MSRAREISDLIDNGYSSDEATAMIPKGRITAEEIGERIPAAPSLRAPYIPARFAEANFNTFDVTEPQQLQARKAAYWFGREILDGRAPMLALIGPPGVGKSHLLYAIARFLHHNGKQVYTNPWYKLADELRWGRGGPNTYESRDIVAELYAQKIVLIDEVRPTANTSFDDTALAKFACHAYDNNVAVMITTNVNPLDLVMGPAAADRFKKIIIDTGSRR